MPSEDLEWRLQRQEELLRSSESQVRYQLSLHLKYKSECERLNMECLLHQKRAAQLEQALRGAEAEIEELRKKVGADVVRGTVGEVQHLQGDTPTGGSG